MKSGQPGQLVVASNYSHTMKKVNVSSPNSLRNRDNILMESGKLGQLVVAKLMVPILKI